MVSVKTSYPEAGKLGNRFITFEGGEGVGKTTQITLLAEWLKSQGYEVLCTREPGGTKGAESLRNLLLFEGPSLSWKAQALGYMAARLDHLENLIIPALKEGKFVLCDRFQDSTWAYQGYGFNGADPEKLAYLRRVMDLCPLEPARTFLLDMPVDEASHRRHQRDGVHTKKDRYESEKTEFHERVREGFLACLKQDSHRVKLIDASQSKDAAAESIISDMKSSLDI